MMLRGFEDAVVVPRETVVKSGEESKGPILKQPPKNPNGGGGKRKMHFLDRTDPNFKKDLATSVKHVEYVVAKLNKHVPSCLIAMKSKLTKVEFAQLETVCRETVTKRRAHSDNGDVEVTWTIDGVEHKAILEVKQRKSPKFTDKSDFPYDTMITDEKRLFDKIRARGDTVGYLVTNHDKTVFLFVSHDQVESTYTTHTSMDRWKGRMRTFVDVPIGEFVQGTKECVEAILQTLVKFGDRSEQDQQTLLLKMSTEKVTTLRTQLAQAHKASEKLQRAIDLEEGVLVKLMTQ
jgi:hypothetical protein